MAFGISSKPPLFEGHPRRGQGPAHPPDFAQPPAVDSHAPASPEPKGPAVRLLPAQLHHRGRGWTDFTPSSKELSRNRNKLFEPSSLNPPTNLYIQVLGEILISLLAPLEELVKFSLNLRNASFLDESWELGWFRRFELVPCRRLGLDLMPVLGRLLVCQVEPASVADEDLKVGLSSLFGLSADQALSFIPADRSRRHPGRHLRREFARCRCAASRQAAGRLRR